MSESIAAEEPKSDTFEVPADFLNPDADLLIKSSDDVLFKVYKAFLITGSTFFRDMFEHPQPPPDGTGAEFPIPWPKPATTIVALLYQLYPLIKPETESIEQLVLLAVAADKWGMDSVISAVKAEMLKSQFLSQRPLAIYNVACRLGLEDLKTSAGRRLVELYDPLDMSLRGDTAGLSAVDFVALCDLRKARISRCLVAVESVFPTLCTAHRQAIDYGPWRTTIIDVLSRQPSSACVASQDILTLALNVAKPACPSRCNVINVKDSVRRLKEGLDDPNHFI